MFKKFRSISQRAQRILLAWTVLGTLSCVVISVAFNYITFRNLGDAALSQSIISAIILPIVLSVPLMYNFTMKQIELHVANGKLQALASRDGLTNCLNRRAFTKAAQDWLDQCDATDPNGALLVIDADHFKLINDKYGHDAGDEALQVLAATIRKNVRDRDLVGRIGGEEFCVLLASSSENSAMKAAERIRMSVETINFIPRGQDRAHPLAVSIGVSVVSGDLDFSATFRQADAQLYLAKENGRNRTVANSKLDDLAPKIASTRAGLAHVH